MRIPVVDVDNIIVAAIANAHINLFSLSKKNRGTNINEAYDCGSQKNEVGRSKKEYKRALELISGMKGSLIG